MTNIQTIFYIVCTAIIAVWAIGTATGYIEPPASLLGLEAARGH